MILKNILEISHKNMLIELYINNKSVNGLFLTTVKDFLDSDKYKALLLMKVKRLSLEKNGICRYALKIELESKQKCIL